MRGKCIHLWYKELSLGQPVRAASEERDTSEKRMFPRECRERRLSYKAVLRGTIMASVDGEQPIELRNMKIAQVPVMLQTQNCHLSKMTRKELIAVPRERVQDGTDCRVRMTDSAWLTSGRAHDEDEMRKRTH